jgi:hypothetical protein
MTRPFNRRRLYHAVLGRHITQQITTIRGGYSFAVQLGCSSPYGQYIRLDGIHP